MKRVGIVGAGEIGRWHVQRWHQLPVELAGYYDIAPKSAAAMSASHGGRVYASLDELIADVDIVDVCTQTTAHKEGVLAAAAAGKATVCEKPLARHLADGEEMVAACERAGAPLFIAQVVRFFPQFAQAKAILDAGHIGKPGVIRTVRAGSSPGWGQRNWFSDFQESGGVIMDVGIHDIDFARWCMGEVERVFARGLSFSNQDHGKNIGDHALIILRFRSGALGHIESSWSHPPGQFRTRVEIAGDGGLLEWDSQDDRPVRMAVRGADSTLRTTASPLAPQDDPYYHELAHFLDCLERGVPFRVSPRDGLMALKIALAAVESMRRGEPVDIDSFKGVGA